MIADEDVQLASYAKFVESMNENLLQLKVGNLRSASYLWFINNIGEASNTSPVVQLKSSDYQRSGDIPKGKAAEHLFALLFRY